MDAQSLHCRGVRRPFEGAPVKPDPTLRGLYTDLWAVGDWVWFWFDTGCMGHQKCFGQVVTVGPKTFTVQWPNGTRNRLRHGEPKGVQLVGPDEQLQLDERAAIRRRIEE